MAILKRFWSNQSGATAIEYSLIAALISLAIIGSAIVLGDEVQALYTDVSGDVSDAVGD